MDESATTWQWLRRFALRFATIYTALHIAAQLPRYVLLLWLAPPTTWLIERWNEAYFGLVATVAALAGREAPLGMPNGSGDTSFCWYSLATVLVFTVIATVIWCVLDHRDHDRRVCAVLRLLLRYALASWMIDYGLMKLFGDGQFATPSAAKLAGTYGESSPMSLLWTFMGYSPIYERAAGAGELVGGLLLLSRRTTLFGALLLLPIVGQVALLNYCYDVPVKIDSTHCLLMAVGLVVPDTRRLFDAIVLHRATRAGPWRRVHGSVRARRAWLAGKALLIANVFAVPVWREVTFSPPDDDSASPFDATYEVVAFTRDGVATRACTDDAQRWRWVSFARGQMMGVRTMDGERRTWALEVLDDGSRVFLHPWEGGDPIEVSIVATGETELHIAGTIDGAAIEAQLSRRDAEDFPLMQRRFRWVSEEPYNR